MLPEYNQPSIEVLGKFFSFLLQCRQGFVGKFLNRNSLDQITLNLPKTQILKLFFETDYPDLTLREIEVGTGLPPNIVCFQMKCLTRLGLMEEVQSGSRYVYRLQVENKHVQLIQSLFRMWSWRAASNNLV